MTRWLLLMVFVFSPVYAAEHCEQNETIRRMFNCLEGEWSAKAVTTPVGPRPYDINFERREPSWIYGQADTGAAIHHWGFYCDRGELWLRFFSTFRDNRSPTLLKAIELNESQIRFRAIDPEFLEVIVKADDKRSTFEVLHHGKQHVLIQLGGRRVEQ